MRTLGWLFVILCAQALSSLAIEIFPTTKHHMPEGLNAVNGITSLHGGRGERQNELKQAKFYPVKRQKGKGSYGGANIDHRPRPLRSAARSLSSPSSRQLSYVLALVWFLFFPPHLSR